MDNPIHQAMEPVKAQVMEPVEQRPAEPAAQWDSDHLSDTVNLISGWIREYMAE